MSRKRRVDALIPLAPPADDPLLSKAVAPPNRISRLLPSPVTAVNVCPQRFVGAFPSAGTRAQREKTCTGGGKLGGVPAICFAPTHASQQRQGELPELTLLALWPSAWSGHAAAGADADPRESHPPSPPGSTNKTCRRSSILTGAPGPIPSDAQPAAAAALNLLVIFIRGSSAAAASSSVDCCRHSSVLARCRPAAGAAARHLTLARREASEEDVTAASRTGAAHRIHDWSLSVIKLRTSESAPTIRAGRLKDIWGRRLHET